MRQYIDPTTGRSIWVDFVRPGRRGPGRLQARGARVSAAKVRIVGIGEAGGAIPDPEASLETMIFAAATAALADAGLQARRPRRDRPRRLRPDRRPGDLLDAHLGPRGRLPERRDQRRQLSPGHALALGLHADPLRHPPAGAGQLLGQGSESAFGVQAAERLSAEPVLRARRRPQLARRRRDAGPAAPGRPGDPERAARAAAARRRPQQPRRPAPSAVAGSPLVAAPLRELEVPRRNRRRLLAAARAGRPRLRRPSPRRASAGGPTSAGSASATSVALARTSTPPPPTPTGAPASTTRPRRWTPGTCTTTPPTPRSSPTRRSASAPPGEALELRLARPREGQPRRRLPARRGPLRRAAAQGARGDAARSAPARGSAPSRT